MKGESKYLEDLIKVFPVDYQDCVKMIVLGMKDISGNYNDKASIKQNEELIGTFFVNNNQPNKKAQQQCIIYQIINKQLNVNYIMREGSLKCDLLNSNNMYFNEKEILFFQNKDKFGPMYLCQLCELIMNGFKSGFKITARIEIKNTLEAKNYLICISMLASQVDINLNTNNYKKQRKQRKNKNSSCKSNYNGNKTTSEITVINTQEIICRNFDINLVTFYPQCYQLVYDTKSSYYQCISKFVKCGSSINWMVNHKVINKDNNGNQTQNITCISIKNSVATNTDNLNLNVQTSDSKPTAVVTLSLVKTCRDHLLVVLMLFLIVLWLSLKFCGLSHNGPVKAFE